MLILIWCLLHPGVLRSLMQQNGHPLVTLSQILSHLLINNFVQVSLSGIHSVDLKILLKISDFIKLYLSVSFSHTPTRSHNNLNASLIYYFEKLSLAFKNTSPRTNLSILNKSVFNIYLT